MTTNRINMPEVAEQVLADGCADLVSMARPWLADGDIMAKAIEGREGEINTCIACNQACLDRTFKGQVAGCVVNPRAGRETEFTKAAPQGLEGRYAVVGGGPAGMSTALELAKRGATVDLYESPRKTRRPIPACPSDPGQRRVRRDPALLPARAGPPRCPHSPRHPL